MFTGIVQAVGKIVRVSPLEVQCPGLGLSDVAIGGSIAVQGVCLTVTSLTGKGFTADVSAETLRSIAVQGVCLTVTSLTGKGFTADVSAETLRLTTGLDKPGEVNLEKSLKLGAELGGHLVAGHVDGVGEVLSRDGGVISFRVPSVLGKYLARKGSVCVDGVSLTVNRVEGDNFEVNLIPHTLEVTTLGRLQKGSRVNLEVDLIARYVERMLAT